MPNALLNSSKVVNESVPRTKRRIRVAVPVAYGTDYDHLESVLLGVAEEVSSVLDAPSPRVRFRSFGDSALELELLCWVPTPVLRGRVTHDLNVGIYEAFAAEGITVPFPQRDVRLVGDAPTAASPEAAASGADDD